MSVRHCQTFALMVSLPWHLVSSEPRLCPYNMEELPNRDRPWVDHFDSYIFGGMQLSSVYQKIEPHLSACHPRHPIWYWAVHLRQATSKVPLLPFRACEVLDNSQRHLWCPAGHKKCQTHMLIFLGMHPHHPLIPKQCCFVCQILWQRIRDILLGLRISATIP